MKNKFFFASILLLISVLPACKMPEVKSPKTNRNLILIANDLKEPGSFQSVTINSNINSLNGYTTACLTLELVNGKNLPAEKNELRNFALAKMKTLFAEIENKSDYELFQVSILNQVKKGIMTQTKTSKYDFTLNELLAADTTVTDSLSIDSVHP